jgi:uncharacterized protein YndB with AHSA1/START domain
MKNQLTGHAGITINASVDKVWDALIKPELIKKYFFGTDTHTSWKEGTPIRFTGEWEGKKYEDKGTVLAFKPKRLISYTYWSSMSGIEDKPENYVTVTYELTEQNGSTLLEVTQENIPDEKMKDHSEENWNKVLEGLKKLVEEEKVDQSLASSE